MLTTQRTSGILVVHSEPKPTGGWLIHLRDVRNGREGTYLDTHNDWSQGVPYNWSEGNYSCDCNRIDFLYGDDPAPGDDEERACTSFVEVTRWEWVSRTE